jgi:hypothetical protein
MKEVYRKSEERDDIREKQKKGSKSVRTMITLISAS